MDQIPARTTRSLSKALTLAVVIATCVILVITIWFSYSQARNALEQQSNAEALKQVQSTADQFDAYLDRVAVLPRAITARKEGVGGETAEGIVPFLSRLLDAHAAGGWVSSAMSMLDPKKPGLPSDEKTGTKEKTRLIVTRKSGLKRDGA